MTQRPDLFWGVVASMYVGNVFLLLLNLPLVGLWVQLLRVPYRVLFPIVLLLSVVGTYSANKNVFDLWVMLGFGVAGYVLRKLEYDLAPVRDRLRARAAARAVAAPVARHVAGWRS